MPGSLCTAREACRLLMEEEEEGGEIPPRSLIIHYPWAMVPIVGIVTNS